MTIPKARKLKSGNWNVQVTLNGRRTSITRPTRKEAEAEARYRMSLAETGRMAIVNQWESKTVAEILDGYIEANRYRLSPTSVQDYECIKRTRFKPVMHKPWNAIDWERAVANELKDYSYNTVMNAWGIIKSAASFVGVDVSGIRIKKPRVQKEEHAFLTEEQMHQFQKRIYGEPLELACLLGLLSLRKSEILGLRRKDVDLEKGIIHVRHTRTTQPYVSGFVAQDATKTPKSTRDIPLILNPRITALIRESNCKPDDYLVDTAKNAVYSFVNRVCRELGFPEIGVHGLRHTFASVCWARGIPMETCMLYGGWSTDKTVRNVYQHLDEAVVNQHTLQLAEAFTIPFTI